MPRRVKHPRVYLALSPQQTAVAMGVSNQVVADAIDDGILIVRKIGAKRRISTANIQQWFETWPRVKRETIT